jgi:hypothetical protein
MADPTGTSQPGLSIHEAAVMLGVAPNTVRRWCASGRLRSQRIPRPQGEMVRVFLDDEAGQVPRQVPPGEVPEDVPNEVPHTSQAQVPTEQARANAMSMLIAASITPVLAPLVAQIEAHRQTVERQAEQLVAQAEIIGRQSAELEALRAQPSTLDASGAPARPAVATESTTHIWFGPIPFRTQRRSNLSGLPRVMEIAVMVLVVVLVAAFVVVLGRISVW